LEDVLDLGSPASSAVLAAVDASVAEAAVGADAVAEAAVVAEAADAAEAAGADAVTVDQLLEYSFKIDSTNPCMSQCRGLYLL
jgi:hypothetical protein